jgi:protein ImuA
MPDSIRPLARLKRQLEQLERTSVNAGVKAGACRFSLGHAALDQRLGGGLAAGALHELCSDQPGDHASASAFALMLACRAAGQDKPILWVREDKGARFHGGLYAPGMVDLGVDPDRIILIQAPDTLACLRVAADILGCMALGAVVIEPWGEAKKLDLTASRKLVLAAEASGVAAFVLREGTTSFASAASTRWTVAAAPSAALLGDAPGHPTLALSLTRHRGGIPPFDMIVEWNRDEQIFREARYEAHLSRPLLADDQRRPLAA